MFAPMDDTAYLRKVLCLFLWSSLFIQGRTQSCEAPDGADFDREPTFWCGLDANVYINKSCTTQIGEVIHLPWAHGRLVRYVPHQTNQRVKDVRAFLIKGSSQTPLTVIEQKMESAKTNTAITIRVAVSKEPIVVFLQYFVENGVELYISCDLTKDIFQDEEGDEGVKNNRYQLVKWSPGGKSAQEIRSLQTTFSLDDSAGLNFVDSPIMKSSEFKVETVSNTSIDSEQIRVKHVGNATNVKPAKIVFYFRSMAPRGIAGCPNSRSCEREAGILGEKHEADGLSKAVLGIGIGVGVLAAAVAIGLWIACLKSLTKKHPENVDNLPISLRHFAYDTGDDKPSGPLRQWARGKNNVGKKEYLAIELSPGNKQEPSEDNTGQTDEIQPRV
ncbi:unnamed protein product [Agarophyton chilense]